jgi:hypothetical protein
VAGIYTIGQLRQSAPQELQSLSDEDLVRDYSTRTNKSFEQVADYLGVKPRGTVSEMGRQLVGGAVVDLPKMVGQGLQYTGMAPQYGAEMQQAAEARAPAYEPDMRGRGLIGQAGVYGARGIAPMAAVAPLAFIPGVGQYAAGAGAAALFGTSSAQDTYQKLIAQGVSEEDASAAARRVGFTQGPLEGAATVAGARLFKPLAGALGAAERTTAGVANALTDTAVAKPFLKGMAINAVVQPGTEVAQDVGTSLIERAYGATPEDLGAIAKQSALGGIGLTALLGPLALGSHIQRSRRAETLKSALFDENTPTPIRAKAMDLVMGEARRQGIPEQNVNEWFDQQLTLEDARNASLQQAAQQAEEKRRNESIDLLGQQAQQLPGLTKPSAFSSLEQQKAFEQGLENVPGLQGPSAFSSPEQQRTFEQGLVETRNNRIAGVGAEYQDLMQSKNDAIAAAQVPGQQFQDMQQSRDQAVGAAQQVGLDFENLRVANIQKQFDLEEMGQQWQELTKELPAPQTTNRSVGGKFQKVTSSELPQVSLLPPAPSTSLLPQEQAPSSPLPMQEPGYSTSLLPTAQVFPSSDTQTVAGLPAASNAAGVFTPNQPSTPTLSGDAIGEQTSQTAQAQQAAPQGQQTPANVTPPKVSIPDVAALRTAEENKQDLEDLTKQIQRSNSTPINPSSLAASVQGAGRIKAPGRVSLTAAQLASVRDMLLNPEQKTSPKADKKLVAIADAVQNFARIYSEAQNAGGNILRMPPMERKNSKGVAEPTPIAKLTPAEQRGKIKALTGKQVETFLSKNTSVQQALAKLGEVVGGNAKDVEAIVKAVKDSVQRELHINTRQEELASAFTKLDSMLSGAWSSAKNESYISKTDNLYVRQSETRQSTEAQSTGNNKTQLENAAEGYAMYGKGDSYEGILGVLKYLQAHGTTFERTLAKAVFESLYSSDNVPKLVFSDKAGPQFDPKKNTITIQRNASPAVSLHESLHGALQWYVYQNPNAPEVLALKESLSKVVGFKGALNPKALEVQKILQNLVKGGNELDAVLELISYGNTLNDFRKALEAMPSKQTPKDFYDAARNVWQKILTVVQKLLGTTPNVAADVISNTFKLLQASALGKPGATRTGKILKAEVQSSEEVIDTATESIKPISDAKIAAALGVSEQDYTRWAKKNLTNVMLTQRLFEAVGWSTKNVEALGGKVEQWGRKVAKDYPALEVVAGLFNSRYNVTNDVSNIQDNYKVDKNVGYQFAERIANYINTQSRENTLAVFSYLDGNTKALDSMDDGGKLKGQADNLKKWFDTYVAELSQVEQAFFKSRKFSENLLFPSKTEEVARSQFGLGKINEVLGKKTEKETNLEEDWLVKDTNGDPVLTGDFHKVFKTDNTVNGQPEHAGFMSVAKFKELNGKSPMGYAVDTTRRWVLESWGKGKQYKFVTNTTAREKIDDQKTEDLANALRNTIAALANNYASKNFITALHGMGREDSIHEQVAYDNVKDINDAYGTQVRDDQVLKVSLEMARSGRAKDLYRMSGTWVKLPPSAVYGELSGKIIPGPVWNAMTDMVDRSPLTDIGAVNTAMRWFKKSKTTQNFGTHVTNAASNVTMAMLHDISFTTMRDATKLLYRYEYAPKSLSPADRAMVESFINSGAMLGDFSSAEVKKALYDAYEKNLLDKDDNDISVATRVAKYLGVEKFKAQYLDKVAASTVKGAITVDETLTNMYAFEDNAFRFAAFLKKTGELQMRDGVKEPTQEHYRTAGKFALAAFGDYDIDSKAVKILRQSVMPFISWGYAMGPMIARIVLTQPWKIANLLAAYALFEGAMASAAGDDDEEARKKGPAYIRDRMFFGSVGPYMNVRIPFMGDDKNPVYYRFGDYFPIASITKGLPNGVMGQSWVPSIITPSGPFISVPMGLFSGVDPFTGKSINQPTDTDWQKFLNSAKFGYDIFSPPSINSRQLSRVQDIIDDKKGITGVSPSGLVFARSAGLKLYDYSVDESQAMQSVVSKKIGREFKMAINKAKREEYSKGYPDYEALDAKIKELEARMISEQDKALGGAGERED